VLRNAFVEEWLGREGDLRADRDAQVERYKKAAAIGDASIAATIVGEGVGLIHAIEPAAAIVERMVAEAEALLKGGAARVRPS
jgi:nitronate monooxygenase